MREFLIMLLILFCIVLVLKIMNVLYARQVEIDEKKMFSTLCLMKDKPSYKTYKRISNKSLHLNNPKRNSGDFYDYVFNKNEYDDKDIENNILNIL